MRRLENVSNDLTDTCFDYRPANDFVEVICPWGNRFQIHEPEERFGRTELGIPYVEFDVPPGRAKAIARFYQNIMGAPARTFSENGHEVAAACVGYRQELIFRETDDDIPEFDGHHIQIYVADFSGPHDKLLSRDLIREESNEYQYRFDSIMDFESGESLYTLDHEIRSLTHPLFARPLVNRNNELTNNDYAPGHENRSWAQPLPT